jgi:RNA polymerase sigma factor (sigma-70 family)
MFPPAVSVGSTGRAADFESLMRPHLRHLYQTAYRFTGSQADAEDLVQEVLVKLYSRVDELRTVEQLRPWLTRVLYRQFVDEWRRRGRSGEQVEPRHDYDGAEASLDPMDRLPSETPGPEQEAERRLDLARLEMALSKLNPDQRALVVLHDMEGNTLEELSPVLDCPLGTLKSRLHRARNRLRLELGMEPSGALDRVQV